MSIDSHCTARAAKRGAKAAREIFADGDGGDEGVNDDEDGDDNGDGEGDTPPSTPRLPFDRDDGPGGAGAGVGLVA